MYHYCFLIMMLILHFFGIKGMINYFLKLLVKPRDVASLMQFLATVQDAQVLKETFALICGLCKGPTKIEIMADLSSKHTAV